MTKKLNLNDYNALNHILLFNNMSRTLLASELEISSPAVFKIIKKLVAKNLILQEEEILPSNGGRPRRGLIINKDYKKILGICLSEDFISLSVAYINGEVIETRNRKRANNLLQARFIKMLVEEIEYVLEKYGKENIGGIGITMPGLVDSYNGIVKKSSIFKNCNINIAQYIEDSFEIPCVADNDIRAILKAESLFGSLKLIDNALLVYMHNSIGASILINKKIYSGQNFAAGQLGKIFNDNNNTLGSYCKNSNIIEKFSGHEEINIDKLDINEVLSKADKNMSPYKEVMDKVCEQIGFSLSNVIRILDIGKIVLAGDVFVNHPFMKDTITKYVKGNIDKEIFENTTIENSLLPTNIEALGALAIVIGNLFDGKKLIR